MSHRMQVVLEDRQYAALLAESRQTGVSMGGLVRAAVRARFGAARDPREVSAALAATAGCWPEAGEGADYVDQVRTGARWDRLAARP